MNREIKVKRLKNKIEILKKIDLTKYNRSDIGAGDLFCKVYKDEVRYISDQDIFMVWKEEKGIWEKVSIGYINELSKEFVLKFMPIMIKRIEDDNERELWLDWNEKLQANSRRSEMIKSTRSKIGLKAELADFDKDPRYLNLENGTIDLNTNKFMPHDRKLMLSKKANVAYDPEARCKRWEKFIPEIMDGDVGLERFLQKAVGYSICGEPKEHCLFILDGPTTRNGKSTFINAISNVLGDYATTIRPETLLVNKYKSGSAASPDIARLEGARFVEVGEFDKTLKLDASNVKSLTGGDRITTRYLFKDPFEFYPQFVFFFHTNHKIVTDDITLLKSWRIIDIPFDVHFSPRKQDMGLKDIFSTPEAKSAILNWILKGHVLYQEEGIKKNMPRKVHAKIREYEKDTDPFGQFIKECIVKNPNSKLKTHDINIAYEEWAKENNCISMSQIHTTKELKRRGYQHIRTEKGTFFKGIELKMNEM